MCSESFGALRRGSDELDDIVKLPNWTLGSPVFEIFFNSL
jgi:hypothetical protein